MTTQTCGVTWRMPRSLAIAAWMAWTWSSGRPSSSGSTPTARTWNTSRRPPSRSSPTSRGMRERGYTLEGLPEGGEERLTILAAEVSRFALAARTVSGLTSWTCLTCTGPSTELASTAWVLPTQWAARLPGKYSTSCALFEVRPPLLGTRLDLSPHSTTDSQQQVSSAAISRLTCTSRCSHCSWRIPQANQQPTATTTPCVPSRTRTRLSKPELPVCRQLAFELDIVLLIFHRHRHQCSRHWREERHHCKSRPYCQLRSGPLLTCRSPLAACSPA